MKKRSLQHFDESHKVTLNGSKRLGGDPGGDLVTISGGLTLERLTPDQNFDGDGILFD